MFSLGMPIAGHVRIVGPFIVVRIKDDVDLVFLPGQQRQRACAAKCIVVGMRGEYQDRFPARLRQIVWRRSRSLGAGEPVCEQQPGDAHGQAQESAFHR
jgi:hypothetical protein